MVVMHNVAIDSRDAAVKNVVPHQEGILADPIQDESKWRALRGSKTG